MKNHIRTFSASMLAIAALFLISTPTSSHAQIVIKTNSLVSYTYDAVNPFVPGEPIAPATGNISTFSYLPTAFTAGTSGAAWDIDTASGVVSLGMDAQSGYYFDGKPIALDINTKVNYSLAAPTGTSSAGAVFTVPFTLYITAVDNNPFASPTLQYSANIPITPTYVETTGPVSFPTGNFTGALTLSLNTIKLHFGIGATNNITGMRLQISPSLSVWSERGSASASVVNFNVSNELTAVPEPSTYALLLLGSGVAGLVYRRRRRA